MEIRYFGHACFFARGKTARLLFDPFDPVMVGLPLKKTETDLLLVSHGHRDHSATEMATGSPYVIQGPGEYEVKGIKVSGIRSFHDNNQGAERGGNTIYLAEVDGVSLCHLGDLGHLLSDQELKELTKVDVLFIPVGGFYTIDAKTAVSVIAQVEPKIVIPMHFRAPKMKPGFDRLTTLEDFLSEMGETPRRESVLKVNREDLQGEEVSLVILENSML